MANYNSYPYNNSYAYPPPPPNQPYPPPPPNQQYPPPPNQPYPPASSDPYQPNYTYPHNPSQSYGYPLPPQQPYQQPLHRLSHLNSVPFDYQPPPPSTTSHTGPLNYPAPPSAPSYSENLDYPPPPSATSHSGPLDYPPPPFTTSHSGCIDYPPPPSTTSHSGRLDYQRSYSASLDYGYPPPPQGGDFGPYPHSYQVPPVSHTAPSPDFQRQSSLPYGPSSHHQYQQPGLYPHSETYPSPALSPSNSFSNHHREESPLAVGNGSFSKNGDANNDATPLYPSVYPHLDDQMGSMKLSEGHPSAPSSPPAPSAELDTVDRGCLFGSPKVHGSPKAHGYSSSYGGSPGSPLQLVPFQESKGGSLKVLLLHGNLDIWVNEARSLPNMDMFHRALGDVFSKFNGSTATKPDGSSPSKITSDPYVTISVANAVIARTYVISNSEDPVWKQHFNVPVAHCAAEVRFVVKDSDVVGSQLIGDVAIPVEHIYSGIKVEGTYPILNASGKPCKPGAVLALSIQYTPAEKLRAYLHGVGLDSDCLGVPGTYFPCRKGGRVTLYQDAHVPDGCLPTIMLDQGMPYVNGKCWQDVFNAIRHARRLVYIVGWSVWHKVTLVRDAGNPLDACLGDLLKSKSQEGVRVLLLVWDDPTSRSILGYKTDGIMATHDEETRRFFKHSSVRVLLCPRVAGKRHSWMKQRETETIYTHHQKTIIVDADAGNNKRKIIAFVGGIDLCDGRYDTPQHSLFRTLQTVHKEDYHNPTFTGSVSGCPREPWHDLHSKIDGPAAYDILTNFEERWSEVSRPHGIKKLKNSDDALLRIERMQDIIGLSDDPSLYEKDPENWHVQIFRSIDSNSVRGFPPDPQEATAKNLVCGKNVLIDMSIHTAYVKAIRAAQHFIYIENQYFIGSSFNWSSNKDLGANNLIPMEIALKIADKIRANERFAAYIVVPMWPEGVPTGAATQRILYWQHKTMQMMYETIYKALLEMGLENAFVPQDYLNFFCLGNREVRDANDTSVGSPKAANSPQALSQKSRRFMIYVHSKGMIVDDEYVILGSANINQRSMEGTRDTEIAMGAYQPQYTWEKKLSYPRGQIYGYRMSLWAEHTGTVEDCFMQPESIECVRRVKFMGETNWKQFAAEDVTEMRGHLLKYPVEVDRRGKVRPLPGCESFPDVGGNICGSFLAIQENLTI